jgi:hypothetical protein
MILINEFLGSQAVNVWLAGIPWSLIAIFAVKLFFIDSKKKFNFKYWLNDNILDIVKGFVWSLIILRMGDYAITMLTDKLQLDIPETTDFVIYMIVISGFIQYRLHKKRKAVSGTLKDEMKNYNEVFKTK